MKPMLEFFGLCASSQAKGPYIYLRVILCVTLGIMLPLAHGEAIHMSRDFGYFSKEQLMQAVHKAPPVVSDQDATKFLLQYGYLKCNTSDTQEKKARIRRAAPEIDLSEGGSDDKTDKIFGNCTKLDIIHATVVYQDLLKLPVTGSLDRITKERMNRKRCGDRDSALVEVEEKRLSGTIPRSSSDRYVSPWMSSKGELRGKRDVRDAAENEASFMNEIENNANIETLDHMKTNERYQSIADSSSHKFRTPPLEEYVDEYGSVFGREEGQVHLKHHHPVPEGTIDDENVSVLEKLLMPNKISRRRQMYNDIKNEIETFSQGASQEDSAAFIDMQKLKDKPVVNISSAKKRRRKRDRQKRDDDDSDSDDEDDTSAILTKFNKDELIYTILPGYYSERIPVIEQCTAISLALRMWAEVTNIDFKPATSTTSATDIDILIAFGRGEHLGCNEDFQGQGGQVAHTNKSQGVGWIHFDDDENWKRDAEPGTDEVPFLLAALHEIGHVLGLDHEESGNSIMHPDLETIQLSLNTMELTRLDRNAIQYLYGVCSGRFDGAFDWLHTKPSRYSGLACMQPCACEEQIWQYYTYFFRENSYWLYLNSRNRPRYGDPLPIMQEWKGLPDKVDAMTQIMIEHTGMCTGKQQTTQFEFQTLFFKDDMVYKYDDIRDTVYAFMKISEMFPPKEGQTESIPDNIDAVIFDPRNNHLFFFKGLWVWELDPFSDNATCCEDKHLFTDLYPSEELQGNVDAGYLRWGEKQVFFYKGDNVYNAQLWEMEVRRGYEVKVWQSEVQPVQLSTVGPWNTLWNDICDVITTAHRSCPY